MRLWHEALIPYLCKNHLSGQHREVCALRGGSWGQPHETVDYVFEYHPADLSDYHDVVLWEMECRTWSPEEQWKSLTYRGKNTASWTRNEAFSGQCALNPERDYIYPEHDESYLRECIELLEEKGCDCPTDQMRSDLVEPKERMKP